MDVANVRGDGVVVADGAARVARQVAREVVKSGHELRENAVD